MTDKKHIAVLLLVSLLLFVPVLIYGVPYGTPDFRHHMQICEALLASFARGEIFADWVFQENAGYGAVTVRFYPPLFHYCLAVCQHLFQNWATAFFLVFAFFSFVGGCGTYLWTSGILDDRRYALLAAMLFLLSPYHLNQAYNASMLGEFAALSLLPFAFYFAGRVASRSVAYDVLGFALTLALLILSNIPQLVVSLVFIAICVLFHLDRSRLFAQIARLSAAGLLAVAGTAFYWVRMVAEIKWLNIYLPNVDPAYDYHNHFLFLRTDFDSQGLWLIDLLFAGLAFFIICSVLIARRPSMLWSTNSLRAISVMTVVASLLMLPISVFIWDTLPGLHRIQFPWRLLSVVSLCTCVIFAGCFKVLAGDYSRAKRPLVLLMIGLSLVYSTFAIKQIVLGASFVDRVQMDALATELQTAKGLAHWLPVWAGDNTFEERKRVTAEGRDAVVRMWEPERREIVFAAGETSEARFAALYYPWWQARVNGLATEARRTAEGTVAVRVPAEESVVELEFAEPRTTAVSRSASGGVWVIMLGAAALLWFRRRRKT